MFLAVVGMIGSMEKFEKFSEAMFNIDAFFESMELMVLFILDV